MSREVECADEDRGADYREKHSGYLGEPETKGEDRHK